MGFYSIRRWRNSRVAAAVAIMLTLPTLADAQQGPVLPRGAQVTHGSATVSASGASALQIDQTSLRAVIDWSDFSIGEGGLVNVRQPGAAAALLNRVTGGNASAILGQLTANGQVYLINPQGIVVGPTGTIDAAAFVGSTLNTSNEAFMAVGPLPFAGASNAAVVNLGTIRTSSGDVVIIAPRIANHGAIEAAAGTAALLSGQHVLYVPAGGSLVVKAPAARVGDADISNTGTIRAAEAVLKAAGGAHALAVNNSGVISATSVTRAGGRIILDGGDGRTVSSGSLTATGTAGGSIDVLGRTVEVTGGVIDASGAARGGQIRIGGGWQGGDADVRNAETTTVADGVTLRANAVDAGDGGTIVTWADGHTGFLGVIEAKGGAGGGDGGRAEVSGRSTLHYGGRTDLTAPRGNTGTLLLDPGTLNIDASTATTIQNNLNTSNVDLLAYDDINVNSAISNATTTNTLTLEGNNIAVNANIGLPNGEVRFGLFGSEYNSLTSGSGASISANLISVRGGFATTNFAGPLVAPSNGLSFNPQAGSKPGSFTATHASNQIKNLYLTSGAVTLNGNVDIRSSVAMQVAGQLVVNGTLTLVSAGDLAFGGGNPTLTVSGLTRLASTGGVFNNNGSLVLNGAGRKVIWSANTGGAFNVTGLGYAQQGGVSFSNDPLATGNVIYTGTTSTLPVLTITADNKTMEYGGFSPTYTASFSGGNASDLTSPVLFQVGGAHGNAGTYTITPYGAASSTHSLSYVPGTLTVTPAPLLITGPNVSMPYGSALPAFTPTYSGFRNGDGPSAVSGLQLSTAATSRSGVGTYPIVLSGGRSPNYVITYANGALTITPALLTIRVNDASRLFGSPNPLFSTTPVGLVNGDTLPPTDLVFSTTAGERSPVGQYAVSASGNVSLANYTVQFAPGILTVTQAPLTVATTSATTVYGQPIPALTTTASGLVAGDTMTSLGITHATTVRQGTGVGVYPTTLTGDLGNYSVTYTPGTISISPAPLRITANDVRRTQFEANPVFTATITGLFGDDRVNGLRLSTRADVTSPAGRYPITPTVGSNPNYFVIFEAGTLTVEQPPPAVIVTGLDQTGIDPSIPNFIPSHGLDGVSVVDRKALDLLPRLTQLTYDAYPLIVEAIRALDATDTVLPWSGEALVQHYIASLRGDGDPAVVGKLLPFITAQAKEVLDKDPEQWSAQESALVNHVLAMVNEQRARGAEQAANELAAWKRTQQTELEKQGLGNALPNVSTPPEHFLTQAQTGVALTAENQQSFNSIMASASTVDTGTRAGIAIVAGVAGGAVVAAIGAAVSVAGVVVITSQTVAAGGIVSIVTTTSIAAVAPAAAAVATFAIPALAVAGIIAQGVQVFEARDYDRNFDAAVTAAKKPMTANDLKNLMSTDNGVKAVFTYMVAHQANHAGGGGRP